MGFLRPHWMICSPDYEDNLKNARMCSYDMCIIIMRGCGSLIPVILAVMFRESKVTLRAVIMTIEESQRF
jgi:hypothetical protein